MGTNPIDAMLADHPAAAEFRTTTVACMRCAADRYRTVGRHAGDDPCAQACVAAATALLTYGWGGITAVGPALVRCADACETVRARPAPRNGSDRFQECARSCRRLAASLF